MNYFRKEIKINAFQSIVIECKRYMPTGKKWRIYVSDFHGTSMLHNSCLYGCHANNVDKRIIKTMINSYISLAKQEGIYHA